MRNFRRDIVAVLVFAAMCVGLCFVPTGYEEATPNSVHAKATVISTENHDLQRLGLVRVGTQVLQARLEQGPDEGKEIPVINQLSGRMEVDEFYEVGDTLLVEYRTEKDRITGYSRGHYRLELEVLLACLFAGLLILVAGWTGVKALLSFVFAALLIWKLMIPMFLKDMDPLPVAIGVVAALTASVSFLVGGLSRKGLATFVGSFSGLVVACVLAFVFSRGFHIHGAVKAFGEALLYAGFPHLDLTRIFVCGVFVACSGAVMDLAMDIAASMDEIKHKRPDISLWEHITSGMRVGRSVVGTMTTTLLLAYSGGYTAMLMFYMGQGTPLVQFFNLNLVAAEILNVLVGSFGLVSVAPLTAVIAGLLYRTAGHADRPVEADIVAVDE